MTRRLPSSWRWWAAFALACAVLLAGRFVLGTDKGRPTSSAPPPSSAVVETGPLAGELTTTPRVPSDFNDPNLVEPGAAVTTALDAGSRLGEWPTITNSYRMGAVSGFLSTCDDIADTMPRCVVGTSITPTPGRVAVLLGDATIQAYWFMLRDVLSAHGWTVVNFSLGGCPAAQIAATGDCARHHAAYSALLARWHPSLVILADGEDVPLGRSTYRAALERTLSEVAAPGRRVLVLSPPPAQPGIAACVSQQRSPQQCARAPYRTWFALNEIDRAATKSTGTTYADLLGFFCARMSCPPIASKGDLALAIRGDSQRLTPEYAQGLGPAFGRYLERIGVLLGPGAAKSAGGMSNSTH